MMSEIASPEDAVESTFEIINANGGNSHRQTPDTPSMPSGESGLSPLSQGVPPAPSALPSFAQISPPTPAIPSAPVQQVHSGQPSSVDIPPPPTSVNSSSVVPQTNPFSARAAGGQSLSSVVHSSPHVPPPSPIYAAMGSPSAGGNNPSQQTGFYPPPVPQPQMNPGHLTGPDSTQSYAMMAQQQPQHTGFDMPFEVGTGQPCDPSGPLSASYDRRPSGVWNWFNKTISGSEFLSKVAEKAKTSVDTMITTLDPQMKDYMNPCGALELYIASADVDLVSNIKTGFSRYFPNLVVRGIPPAFTPNIAQQPVGFEQGVNAVKESIRAIHSSGLVAPNSLILAFSSFLTNSYGENWLEFYCVALSNGANIDLHTFTQPVAVPNFVMDIIKHQTTADYLLASSGFACNVDQVMSHSHGLTTSSWHLQYAGLTKSELIGFACVSLAYLYRATTSCT